MPYVAMKLDDAPVVMVRVTGKLDAEIHFRLSQEVANLVEYMPGKIHRINDLTGVTSSIMDMADVASQMSRGWAGTASDPRISSTAMVLDNPNLFLGMMHLVRAYDWGCRLRVCATLLEAITLVRAEIAAQQEAETSRLTL